VEQPRNSAPRAEAQRFESRPSAVSLRSIDHRPALHEESEEHRCVFRVFEISGLTLRVASKSLVCQHQHLLHFGDGWHTSCITQVSYANCIQQCEQEPSPKRQRGRSECGPRILANLASVPSHYGGNGQRLVQLNDHRKFTTWKFEFILREAQSRLFFRKIRHW